MLEGLDLTEALTPFGLNADTKIKIEGPRAGYTENRVILSLDDFDEAFRKAIFDALTLSIEDRLVLSSQLKLSLSTCRLW